MEETSSLNNNHASDKEESDQEFHDANEEDSVLPRTTAGETDLDEQRSIEEEKLDPCEIEKRRSESLDLKEEANQLFSKAEYESAIKIYTDSLNICPVKFKDERSVLYGNRAACHKMLNEKELAIKDCSTALELKPAYIKCLIRRGELYESLERYSEALDDFKKVLELDPSNRQATIMCCTLPPKVQEKQEQMKQEMIGQLKQLGNLVLKPFGLSTDNFKLQQDPNSGGYTVNFQR
ncbi:cytochrome c oxidase subunit 1 [Cichlidogyrus casuarinus]|uniref:Cytochrome c oxidase subunit 1 n=1 Tax=Cichlidogyrus casuarinus TaxID=1844966 RepID=A0ABD2QQS4_9PLAT